MTTQKEPLISPAEVSETAPRVLTARQSQLGWVHQVECVVESEVDEAHEGGVELAEY